MAEFKYELTKELGVLSSSKSGWQRELNMVSWNDNKAKLDIRDWAPEHAKMSKGISLSHEEAAILREILNDLNLDEVFA
ncbi:MAG: PC4/YdbC family ssDNA-binding protein [Eubacteriales bacterium]|nr:PC4/YdbC family ssDNA-binding protein [Eubacteriales bacterium]